MKIGIVGIGGISQKAYLPYLRQLSGIDWHLFTRNQEVLTETTSLFGSAKSYDSLAELLEVDLDGVMIHAATVAHVELASAFLTRGIPVYMDKPLAESYEATRQLFALAKQHGTFLMTGFNRRFAPGLLDLKQATDKTKIVVYKNDLNRPGPKTFKLFDFFIHPLDTALFLANGRAVRGDFRYQLTADGLLSQIALTLETDQAELIEVGMNLRAGSRQELMEVQTHQATYQLENLDNLTIIEGTTKTVKGFGAWDTTLYKRGFETIVAEFLQAIKTRNNPVSPETSLLSHYLIDQINRSEKIRGSLDFQLPLEERKC